MITRVGEGRHHSNYFCSAEALSEKKKRKRGSQGNTNKDTAQRLSHHTARKLGWVYIAWGRGAEGEGEREGRKEGVKTGLGVVYEGMKDQNPAGVL